VKKKWLNKRLVHILALLLVIAIAVVVFYVYRNYLDKITELKAYGYLGIFLISILFNATLILPVGNFLVIATVGATLPSAALVGLIGGVGAAIGETTGYVAGHSGRTIILKRQMYTRLERWVKKWGALAIFVLSAVPFFFDLAGIAAGALRLPLWRFLVACWLGRSILYGVIAWLGAQGLEALLPDFDLQ